MHILTATIPRHERPSPDYFQHKWENRNHEELYVMINGLRGKYKPLDVDHRLELAAHVHAYDLATRSVCSQTGPKGETLSERMAAVNFPWEGGKQILICGGNAKTREREILKHKLILKDLGYRFIGIGNSYYFYVIILAR